MTGRAYISCITQSSLPVKPTGAIQGSDFFRRAGWQGEATRFHRALDGSMPGYYTERGDRKRRARPLAFAQKQRSPVHSREENLTGGT